MQQGHGRHVGGRLLISYIINTIFWILCGTVSTDLSVPFKFCSISRRHGCDARCERVVIIAARPRRVQYQFEFRLARGVRLKASDCLKSSLIDYIGVRVCRLSSTIHHSHSPQPIPSQVGRRSPWGWNEYQRIGQIVGITYG
jgi:hypothetical protein